MSLLYKDIKNSPSVLLSLTGLTKTEFESLLPLFEKAEEEYIGETYIKGKERERAPGAGRKPKLGTPGDRLFFILFYLKTCPLRQVTAVLFGMKPESDRYPDSQAFRSSEKIAAGRIVPA